MQSLTTFTGFEVGMRKIAVAPQVQSTRKRCPDPVGAITAAQIATLDPTGARTRLFSEDNVDRARVGDILLVRQKDGDPFSGVCLNIKQGDSKIDSSILLRNNLTRVGVEMSYKIYSPNVEGIEVVQRKAKRGLPRRPTCSARRARRPSRKPALALASPAPQRPVQTSQTAPLPCCKAYRAPTA